MYSQVCTHSKGENYTRHIHWGSFWNYLRIIPNTGHKGFYMLIISIILTALLKSLLRLFFVCLTYFGHTLCWFWIYLLLVIPDFFLFHFMYFENILSGTYCSELYWPPLTVFTFKLIFSNINKDSQISPC
jgi:hypothetical protein